MEKEYNYESYDSRFFHMCKNLFKKVLLVKNAYDGGVLATHPEFLKEQLMQAKEQIEEILSEVFYEGEENT